MFDPANLLERQAEWQRKLRDIPWPEKLRMAARVRESVIGLRRAKHSESVDRGGPPAGPGHESGGKKR
jgi:hypothetical protein